MRLSARLNRDRFGKGLEFARLVCYCDGDSAAKVARNHFGLSPIEYPSILDRNQRVISRRYIAQ